MSLLLPRVSRRFASGISAFTVAAPTLSSCASPGSKYQYARTDAKRAVIFIHGYYGANLRRPIGERVWLNVRNAFFNLNTAALPNNGLGIADAEELVEDGLLLRVPVLPWLYSVDAYSATLTWLENTFPESTVIPFSYDWRHDARFS